MYIKISRQQLSVLPRVYFAVMLIVPHFSVLRIKSCLVKAYKMCCSTSVS